MSEELDDTACCPVCFEEYEAVGGRIPRLLPCTHTLCHDCVDSLIKGGSLTCPQDRLTHTATKGCRTFPQNKYILKHLQKPDPRPKGAESAGENSAFKLCDVHERELSLYCKNSKCQREICQLCHINTHMGHRVVDILQELEHQRNDFSRHIQKLKTTVKRKRKILSDAKEKVNDICEQSANELKKRRAMIVKDIDTAINEIEQNAQEEQKKIQEKIGALDDVVTMVDALADNAKRCGSLSSFQDHFEILEAAGSSVVDTCLRAGTAQYYQYNSSLPVDFMKRSQKALPVFMDIYTFETPHRTVDFMCTLPDKTVLCVGKDVSGKSILSKFTLVQTPDLQDPGTLVYSTTVNAIHTEGLVPVTFGDRHCVGVLCCQGNDRPSLLSRTLWMLNASDLDETVDKCGVQSERPVLMCRGLSDGLLVYLERYVSADNNRNSNDNNSSNSPQVIHVMDCGVIPPKSRAVASLEQRHAIWDMCCVKHGEKELLVVVDGSVSAYDMEWGELEWVHTGEGEAKGMFAQAVAADRLGGRLFVCDTAGKSVRLFSAAGVLMGPVITSQGIPRAPTSSSQVPGTPTNTSSSSHGLFGAPTGTSSSSNGLFGSPTGTKSSSNGFFGSPTDTSSSSHGFFGTTTNTTSSSHGFFGAPTGANSSPHGFFGAPTGANSSSHGFPGTPTGFSSSSHGFFGTPTSTSSSSHGFFGAPTNTSSSSHGFFGAPTGASSISHGFFGTPTNTSSSSNGFFGTHNGTPIKIDWSEELSSLIVAHTRDYNTYSMSVIHLDL